MQPMMRSGLMLPSIAPTGSSALRRRPSDGRPCLWHDDGVLAEHQTHGVRQAGDLLRLDAQDDDVVLAGLAHVAGRDDVARDVLFAVFHDQLEPVALNRLEMRAARDDRDILARQREFGGEQAAHGARAYDAIPHDRPPTTVALPRAGVPGRPLTIFSGENASRFARRAFVWARRQGDR